MIHTMQAEPSPSNPTSVSPRPTAAPGRAPFERDLLRGSLEVLILAALADGRRYAYRLQKTLAAAGGQPIAPGTLHPMLRQLEAAGWITSEWETGTGRPRHWYALTEAGRDHLLTAAVQWQACLARMQGLVLPALRSSARRGPRSATRPIP